MTERFGDTSWSKQPTYEALDRMKKITRLSIRLILFGFSAPRVNCYCLMADVILCPTDINHQLLVIRRVKAS